MTKEMIGMISGAFVVLSIIPYAIRTYQGKVHPVLTSWMLWSTIGLTLLLTYKSSGAEDNVWPAVFGFTNPTLIALIAYIRKGERVKLDLLEKWCIVLCGVALAMWLYMRNNPELAQYALYIAIVADFCAAGPTFKTLWAHPSQDRPVPWGVFAFGYGLALFAIPKYTFANCILPTYMATGSISVMLILLMYRIKTKIPVKEWV